MIDTRSRSLTGFTVTAKLLDTELLPLYDTVTVRVTVPNWLVAGCTLMVRLLPLPPKTIFLRGIKFVSDELEERARLTAGVSTSPRTKVIFVSTLSSFTV